MGRDTLSLLEEHARSLIDDARSRGDDIYVREIVRQVMESRPDAPAFLCEAVTNCVMEYLRRRGSGYRVQYFME